MTDTAIPHLTKSQRNALIFIGPYSPTLRELRANGFRRDVVDRLCRLKLAFWSRETHGDQMTASLTRAGCETAEALWA